MEKVTHEEFGPSRDAVKALLQNSDSASLQGDENENSPYKEKSGFPIDGTSNPASLLGCNAIYFHTAFPVSQWCNWEESPERSQAPSAAIDEPNLSSY